MVLRGLVRVVWLATLMALPSTGSAQTAGETTGAIDGTVTDRTGGALPGATIRIAGPALMGTRTALSAADGFYRFPALPPGVYRMTFDLAGFQSESRADVRVAIGSTRRVPVTLDVARRSEEVSVRPGTEVLDRSSTVIATTFVASDLEHLPGSRNSDAILAATPAVQQTRFDVGGSAALAPGPFSAYGTKGLNRPTLEGIVITGHNPFGFTLDYGSFDLVSVGAGAYGPEWPTPGVHIQFITKSGGNKTSGSFYAGYGNRRWQSHNIDEAQIERGAASHLALPAREANRLRSYHDINADAGGFIRKDRVWWYGSLRDQGSSARHVIFPVKPLETQVTTVTGKGTGRLGDDHRFIVFGTASRNRQPIRLDGFLRPTTAVNETPDSTTSQLSTGTVWKVEWNAILRKEFLLELRSGQFVASRSQTPNGDAPRFEDVITPEVAGGNRNWQDDQRRDQILGSLTYFKDGWIGRHQIKAGIEIQRLVAGETWREGYPDNVLHVLRDGLPYEVYLVQAPSRSEAGQFWYGVYAGDAWQVSNRTTLNIGLRFDRFRLFLPQQAHPAGSLNATSQVFPAVGNLMDWNVLAPRIAASHDIAGDGRTVLKASYGRYWLPTETNLAFNVNPNSRVWWRRFGWSDLDGSGLWERGEEHGPELRQGGETIEAIDSGLKLAFVREVTARIERQIAANVSVQTGLVWRGERQQSLRQRGAWSFEEFTVNRSIQDPGPDGTAGTPDDGPDIQVRDLPPELLDATGVVVRNVPDSASDHLTWEATARRRFSRGWSLFASFAHTWNREHASGYLGQPVRANEYPVTPNDFINTDERGRHVFRVWSAKIYSRHEGPWGLWITPMLRHQSGQPFGRTLAVTLDYGTVRVLAEPIGTRRQDHITIADLRVERAFRIPGAGRLTGFVEVFNAFNANPAQNISWATRDLLRPLTILPPRIARLGMKIDW